MACKNTAPGALDAVWKVLLWSFKALEKGEWPTHCPENRKFTYCHTGGAPSKAPSKQARYRADKAGTRLAGDFVAYIVKVKADLMALGNTFKLPVGHHSSTYPCWMCKCDKETQKTVTKTVAGKKHSTTTVTPAQYPFTDIRRGALGRIPLRTPKECRDLCARSLQDPDKTKRCSPLFHIIDLAACIQDSLHVADLGYTQRAVGSVFKSLLHDEPHYQTVALGSHS